MNLRTKISDYQEKYVSILEETLENEETKVSIEDFLDNLARVNAHGGRVFFIGNGASATIANHAALDFMKAGAMQTESLTSSGILTMLVNDYNAEQEFAEWLAHKNLNDRDMVVLISSSGTSQNIINAWIKAVNTIDGAKIFAFTGFEHRNWIHNMCFNNVWVNSNDYNVVENIHSMVLMMICDLFSEK
jgi:D-sedoheptulose 7-phosphate isomerase